MCRGVGIVFVEKTLYKLLNKTMNLSFSFELFVFMKVDKSFLPKASVMIFIILTLRLYRQPFMTPGNDPVPGMELTKSDNCYLHIHGIIPTNLLGLQIKCKIESQYNESSFKFISNNETFKKYCIHSV